MILYGNYIYAIHVHLMSKHFGLTRKCITPCYDLLRTYYMCREQIINYYNLNIVQGASTCVQCLLQEALGQINISCIRGDQHSGREHGLLPLHHHHLHCTTTHDHLHQSPHPTQCPAPTPLPHSARREHQQPPEDPPLPELGRSRLGGGGGVNGRHPHAPTSSLRLLHPRPAQLQPKLLYRPVHWKAQ